MGLNGVCMPRSVSWENALGDISDGLWAFHDAWINLGGATGIAVGCFATDAASGFFATFVLYGRCLPAIGSAGTAADPWAPHGPRVLAGIPRQSLTHARSTDRKPSRRLPIFRVVFISLGSVALAFVLGHAYDGTELGIAASVITVVVCTVAGFLAAHIRRQHKADSSPK
jgi:hypothetical protein